MSPATPLVSILTPTYNHEHFIGNCIESVLRQTYSNWEQIIVNDGSSDGTLDVVSSYSDPRIRVLKNSHRGVEGLAHTYNEALAKSKGELIAILEGDDLWPSEKLSILVPVFSNPKIVLAYGTAQECSPNGILNRSLNTSMRRHLRLQQNVLFNRPPGSTAVYMARADAIDLIAESTVLIRRAALQQIGGFQYVSGLCVASYPTFLKLSLLGEFHFVPRILGIRRRHALSASIRNASAILAGTEHCARGFLLGRSEPLPVSEMAYIDLSWRKANHASQFTAGRVALIEKRWSDARSDFTNAFSLRLPRIFLASLIGWALAGLRCDFENILGFFGKARLTSSNSTSPIARQQ